MTTKDVNAAIWAIEAPEAVKRGILGPMYTRSLDASMAVIQRRWPGATVLLSAGGVRMTTIPGLRTTKYTYRANATEIHHALALALLAALEAETKP